MTEENFHSTKPWFKKPWFIILVLFLILLFGLPSILNLFIKESPNPKFSVLPGQEKVNQSATAKVDTEDDPSLGWVEAPVVIVEFADFECPYCREAESGIKQVLQQYPEVVRFQVRDFPISSLHPQAFSAARAANCAKIQGKYWQYHDALFKNQDQLSDSLYLSLASSLALDVNLFKTCLESQTILYEIQEDLKAGIAAGVTGTPTWFVNDYRFEGVISFADWQKIITAALKQKFSQ